MTERYRGNYRLQIRENYRLPKTLSELHEAEDTESEEKKTKKEKKVLYVRKK